MMKPKWQRSDGLTNNKVVSKGKKITWKEMSLREGDGFEKRKVIMSPSKTGIRVLFIWILS